MSTTGDPLAGIERLLVDGNNLLGALRRGPAAVAIPGVALVGRLRAAIPAEVRIELIFDGPPDPGSGGVRVATGVTVRYAGRVTADALIVRLVMEAAAFDPITGATILVISDDAALGAEVRRQGGLVARTAWLVRRLERIGTGGGGGPRTGASPGGGARVRGGTPTLGHGRAPRRTPELPPPGPRGAEDDADGDAPGWRPGRGATAKRGNPKRRPRSVRDGDGR